MDKLPFPTLSRWSSFVGLLPGTRENYAALAGVLWENATVKIAHSWISKNFAEPQLVATRGKYRGKGKPLDSHPALDLLANPNPYYDGNALNSANLLSIMAKGEFFNMKVRNGYGVLKEIYYLHHDHVFIESDGGEPISRYIYRPGWGAEDFPIEPEHMIHGKLELDPTDTRHGLSPLRAIQREIVSDNAASTYTASLLQNMGALGVIFASKNPDIVLDESSVQNVKRLMRNSSGDGTGEPIVSPVALDAHRLGLSPEQLKLDVIRHYPQDQILAALGLNSTAMNLPSGAGTKTYSNFGEAIKQCYTGCLMPLQSIFAQVWNSQVVPELDDGSLVSLGWDYSQVAALQEDQTALVERLTKEWQLGLIDRFTYLSQRGYKPKPSDKDVYYANPAVTTSNAPKNDGEESK